jgi:hypothetical protein
VLRNPEPDTVSVTALDPAGIVVGLMDEIAGVGVVPLPPVDPPEPEFELGCELPPPHPFTKAVRTNTKARKRTDESDDLHCAQTLSKGPSFPNAANSIVGMDCRRLI